MAEKQAISLMFLYGETPLHPGTGSSLGIVDLPVQRERTTSYPLIQASAIKGVLRALGRDRGNGDLAMLFGSEKQEYAGAMSFSDARILLFPVRSLAGVFCWITSPAVLARLQRDATLSGQALDWKVPVNPQRSGAQALVTAASEAVIPGPPPQVVLEEYLFQPQEQAEVTKIAGWLAANALPATPEFGWWREKLGRSLVVLHDDDFRDFVTTATEVVARTRLKNDTKTVETGGLWYQEFLPAETLFYSLALAQTSRDPQKLDAEAVLERFKNIGISRLQIGGDETTGKGFCALRYT